MKTAFLYAGQGSQHPGMGADLYEAYPEFRAVLDSAEVGFDLKTVSFTDPDGVLNQTEYTQPCMVAFAAGMTAILAGKGIRPDYAAGLSLGEYSALCAAGVFTAKQAVELAAFRGRAMAAAAAGVPCGMTAVLGLDRDKLRAACEAAAPEGVVEIANYNCPGQLVCAGEKSQIEAFCQKVEEAGGRAKMLAVSGGVHSPFMESASQALAQELAGMELAPSKVPVYANYTARPYDIAAKELLVNQVKNPVRWQETVERLAQLGVDTFIECGPGKTLCGLIRKTVKGATVLNVQDAETLRAAVEAVKARG